MMSTALTATEALRSRQAKRMEHHGGESSWVPAPMPGPGRITTAACTPLACLLSRWCAAISLGHLVIALDDIVTLERPRSHRQLGLTTRGSPTV